MESSLESTLISPTGAFTERSNQQLTCDLHLLDPTHTHAESCYVVISPLSIVELFQSQGCSSSFKATPTIHEAVSNPDMLLLTYSVTYWDRPDWKDTFSSLEWNQRQQQYLIKWGRTSLFTPQVIVNGITDGVGARPGEIADLVARARNTSDQMNWFLNIHLEGNTLNLTSGLAEADGHEVLIVSYDPNQQVIEISNGVNRGSKMVHQNVVRSVEKVGEWRGGYVQIELPDSAQDGVKMVVLVQGINGGAIVGALKI